MYIPEELLHIILDYDGRIKYKNGKYVDIVHKHDARYSMLIPIINKKILIMKKTEIHGDCFYFEFGFDTKKRVGLCYDYNFTFPGKFEICYYNTRAGWIQIRTYL